MLDPGHWKCSWRATKSNKSNKYQLLSGQANSAVIPGSIGNSNPVKSGQIKSGQLCCDPWITGNSTEDDELIPCSIMFEWNLFMFFMLRQTPFGIMYSTAEQHKCVYGA